MAPTNDEYYTPDDLVVRYKNKITKTTLANWRSTNDGPDFRKIGGRVLYPISAVIAWEKTRDMRRQSTKK